MSAIALTAIILYAYAGVTWLRANDDKTIHLVCAIAAVLLHAVITISISFADNAINFSLFSVSNITSICLSAVILGISCVLAVKKLAAPLFFLAALNIVLVLLADTSSATPLSLSIAAHVLPSIIAYSLFSLAAVLAVVIWIQHNALKQHNFSSITADLPPIDIMERTLIVVLIIAYILLSASIATGFVTLDNFFAQKLAHKTVFSLLAWATYTILLGGHFMLGWRGMTAVKWTIGGFGFLMLGFIGTKLVLEIILS